jgi:hypothetical protein
VIKQEIGLDIETEEGKENFLIWYIHKAQNKKGTSTYKTTKWGQISIIF